MCRLRIGNEISSREDVRNLVSAIIFRMNKPFKVSDVEKSVAEYLKDSSCMVDEEELKYIVDEELKDLLRFRSVNYSNGSYVKTPQILNMHKY